MIYKAFQDLQLSQLGFGTMRLPLREDKSIDEELAAAMTDAAIRQGVNYFDTAWPYHSGKSETVIGKILQNYPRESFYLTDKFPGHQIAPTYDVADIFERQLKKCGVEYFDFYLLHNVYENSIGVYEDARWNIIPYLLEQKKNGRIRHLGFSTHAGLPALEQFLQRHGEEMEFCQIQLNYLDWTLQQAKEKCELLNRYNIPIWVMEPIRGGKLANLPESMTAELRAMRPEASAASWALRWVQQIPGVTMILSGMSDLAQMEDNLATFDHPQPLSERGDRLPAPLRRADEKRRPLHGLPLLLRRLPAKNQYPADAARAQRDPHRPVHERDHGGRGSAGVAAAVGLSWLRRMRRDLSAEDRYPRLHAGADRADRKDPELGRDQPPARSRATVNYL